MDALPRVRLLDPRPYAEAQNAPIRDAVNIPASELGRAKSELPPAGEGLAVADIPDFDFSAVDALGRPYTRVPFAFGPSERGRLWEPSRLAKDLVMTGVKGRALDIGAGTGRDAVFLAANGWQVVALDHARDFVERGTAFSQRYLPPEVAVEWIQGDAADFARFGCFDAVLMVRYLSMEVVKRVHEVLVPGGRLLLECFHPEERHRTGHPRSEALVASPEQLRAAVEPILTVHCAEFLRHEGRDFTVFEAKKGQ